MSKSVTLSSGHVMPTVGLGTWQGGLEIERYEDVVENSIKRALDYGYRHFDTAYFYNNEEAIGRALKTWLDEGNDREDLFITTKLPPQGNRASDIEAYNEASLEKLGLDYVDMYLIHAPFTFVKDEESFNFATDNDGNPILDYDTDHVAIWKAMEALVENGKARSIGISNFTEPQIMNIVENAEIKPSNLQIEVQCYMQQRHLRDLCEKHNIVVTAYSTFGSPGAVEIIKSNEYLKLPNLFDHPVVKAIAEAHGKTEGQVLLRHQVQGGMVVIPKSYTPSRIKENFDIFNFELTDDEMQKLDELDLGDKGRIFRFPNIFRGVEKHPHCPH